MNRAYIPPGGVAKAHIHVDFDVMIYLLKEASDTNMARVAESRLSMKVETCSTLSQAAA